MQKNSEEKLKQLVGFLGIGLDTEDEEKRLTFAEHFLLVGGSEETHERMQDTAVKFEEELKKTGKKLHEATLEEVIFLFHKIQE